MHLHIQLNYTLIMMTHENEIYRSAYLKFYINTLYMNTENKTSSVLIDKSTNSTK